MLCGRQTRVRSVAARKVGDVKWQPPIENKGTMINNCDEKFRLAEVYQLATTRFSEAVKKLRQRMGTSPKAEYARLDRAANEERE
jgi:hypothetical protein